MTVSEKGVHALTKQPKRYYWLKLPNDFFSTKEVKRLRRIAGGDTFTVIYLKMLLKALKTDGRLYYEGYEDTFISELAMDIDEEEQNVCVTVNYLMKYKLLDMVDETEYVLPKAVDSIGSETAVAERVRRHRQKEKALQCNTSVTQLKQSCNVEKEIEIEKELELEIELEKENKKKASTDAPMPKKRFVKPSLQELEECISEKGYVISAEDFMAYYESNGWKVGRNPMKSWTAALAMWNSRALKQRGFSQQRAYKSKTERNIDAVYRVMADFSAEEGDTYEQDGYTKSDKPF